MISHGASSCDSVTGADASEFVDQVDGRGAWAVMRIAAKYIEQVV